MNPHDDHHALWLVPGNSEIWKATTREIRKGGSIYRNANQNLNTGHVCKRPIHHIPERKSRGPWKHIYSRCKPMITALFSTHMSNLIRRITKLKSEWMVIYIENPTCCGDAKKFFGIGTDLLFFDSLREKSLFKLWCTDCRLLDDLICNNIQVKLKTSLVIHSLGWPASPAQSCKTIVFNDADGSILRPVVCVAGMLRDLRDLLVWVICI